MAGEVWIVNRLMTLKRAIIALASATLVLVVCLLGSPHAMSADARHGDAQNGGTAQRRAGAHSAIRLKLAVGYQNIYRGGTWTPVHVTVRNTGSTDVAGTVEIPQAQSSATGAQPNFHGLYEAPAIVPAGATKDVTLYIPGSGIQGKVSARFLAQHRLMANASASPIGLDTSALLIGVLAGGSGEMAWVAPAIQRRVTTHVIRLSPERIAPVSDALSAFDIIVLTNVDTSQLDRAQLGALHRYVENGGSLLLVGGPAWQETLRPLVGVLLPGHLNGMRILPDLRGLSSLAPGRPPSGRHAAAAVSVLSQPSGTVLASQSGVPLVVRTIEGQGTVEYVAFDPSLSPIRGWSGASALTEHLVATAAPLAISRTWSPTGFRARFQRIFQASALSAELSNLPAATVPFLALFAALTLGYVLILGPINFLVLRRLRRQSLAWVTIPVLGLTYLGSIFTITAHARAGTAELNTVGLVTLGSSGGSQPAILYMGLATPMAGDYHLTYRSAALPAPLPQLSHPNGFFFRNASTLHDTPLRMRLQEDPQTAVTFLSMRRWSIRDMALTTTVHIPGAVQSGLTIDGQGNVAGSIRNGTHLDLLDPVIVAGQSVEHLPTIPAGGSVHARLRPSVDDTFGGSRDSVLSQAYGGSDVSPDGDFGGFRDCCSDFSYPEERRLINRVRNAVSMLSQAQPRALSRLGEVFLIGWTERPLGAVRVDGSTPQRRDLALVVTPLSVGFPSQGAFRLRVGTVGSHLVDILPRAPQSSCCGFGWGGDQENVSVGPGGYFTFEFDLRAGRHVRFQRLALTVSNPEDSTTRGRVYDWRAQRWVRVDLSSGSVRLPAPNRFISSAGQVMVRVESDGEGDLSISDPYHDLQLSGAGAVA